MQMYSSWTSQPSWQPPPSFLILSTLLKECIEKWTPFGLSYIWMRKNENYSSFLLDGDLKIPNSMTAFVEFLSPGKFYAKRFFASGYNWLEKGSKTSTTFPTQPASPPPVKRRGFDPQIPRWCLSFHCPVLPSHRLVRELSSNSQTVDLRFSGSSCCYKQQICQFEED